MTLFNSYQTVLVTFVLFVTSLSQDDGITFVSENSLIKSASKPTTAISKVTDWDVFLSSSSALLGVESFVPVTEKGFWIVGFKSTPVAELFEMISPLGQVKMLKDEERNGFCSNMPYFYNYTISDIVENHSLYKEDNSGDPLSIFDWRSRPPYNPIVTASGIEYDKTALKAMSATLRTLMNCMGMSRKHKEGAFVFEKTLYHTYVRVKDECLNLLRFSAVSCIDVVERTTQLVWKLNTHIVVLSSVASTAYQWVAERHSVTAQGQDNTFFTYTDTQGRDLVEGNVTLNLEFTAAENEFYFYIPHSFNITGSEGLIEWEILNKTNCNLTDPIRHVMQDIPGDWETENITSEIYKRHLAGKTFPISLLPPRLSNNISFEFTFTNDLSKTRDKIAVKQDFGFINCNSGEETKDGQKEGVREGSEGSEPERVCTFGHKLTSVSTGVAIEVTSETQVYSAGDIRWGINLVSVSAGNGDNITTPLSTNRPLYATESLFLVLDISPKLVLKNNDIKLMYLTLSLQTNLIRNNSYSYILYINPAYESETPPDLAEYQDKQLNTFGRFNCSSSGLCSLMLVSEVFADSPSGDYVLVLALKLESKDEIQRRKRSAVDPDYDVFFQAQTIKTKFGFNSGYGNETSNKDTSDACSCILHWTCVFLLLSSWIAR